jgi:CheY-like chemotaxis protein
MKRVLFVDDEPEQVKYHVMALKDRGYEVQLIDSPNTALQFCLRNYGDGDPTVLAYNLLILDMMMPPPSGVQPARVDAGLATGAYILGEHHRHHPGIPTMLFSNLNEDECVEATCRVCQDVLPPKPHGATHGDLVAFLKQHLNVTICEKRRTPPFLLPVKVQQLIGPP